MNDLIYGLLCETGLGVEGSYIVDQDYGDLIYFNGKNVRYSDGTQDVVLTRKDMVFDPFNVKFMSILFSYYLNKLHNLEGRYFSVYYSVDVMDKAYLEIKESNGAIFRSDAYRNETLRFYDLIFKISESRPNVNLHIVDEEITNGNYIK